MARLTPPEMISGALEALRAALAAARIDVEEADVRPPDHLSVLASVDDRPISLPVEVVSYCTGERARELIARGRGSESDALPIVVADRITADARATLSDHGWSWLDRRGRLHLHAPGIRVDMDLPSQDAGSRATPSGPAIKGIGGITVAYWLCAHPGESLSPTRNRGALGLAPSTISTAVRRLTDAGLVDEDGRGVFPELFWELASVWRTDRTWIATVPDPALYRPVDPISPVWRRTGSAAAAAYGAPLVAAEGGPVELYVPGPIVVSIAARRHGAAPAGAGAAVLAVPPTRFVVAAPDEGTPAIDGWPAAPVLAVALDLAQDQARGREILSEWSMPDAVWR